MTTAGRCEGCGELTVLLPLHGPKGGPLRCPLCVGQWNAEHGRKRRTGRIAIRAIKAFQDAGGKWDDIDMLKLSASDVATDLGLDPLGYMTGIAKMDGADIELTSELLADVLKLTHPDHHPPERQELAHRVTQALLALQPFVFPAPKPEPEAEPTSEPSTRARKTSEPNPSTPRYPCADCADAVPSEYCDACSAEYDKREHEQHEREKAKQREWYAKRPKMWTPPKPPKGTPRQRTTRQSRVANQVPGSNLISHWLSGLQVAILQAALTKRVPGARGCDVSHSELLAEIWGWKPQCELRWTEEVVKRRRRDYPKDPTYANMYRAGDTRSSSDTYGAFSHIPPHVRRSARACLSRALTRLHKRMLIEFVWGTGCYSGGLVLTPHGEQIARSLLEPVAAAKCKPISKGR
jgi:hypothetical protein